MGLMLPCLPPEAPADARMGALLESYTETAMRLHACRDMHEALIVWVKAGAEYERQ